MIAIRKLMTLTPKHGARKAANTLDLAERAYRQGDCSFAGWVGQLCSALADDWPLDGPLRDLAAGILADAGAPGLSSPESGARICNRLRRGLEAFGGVSPADWDFREPLGTVLDGSARRVFAGVRAYLEDIRSPFNVGSIFRTADAFGASELILSGFVPDPSHPRSERTALGATGVVPWRRAGLEALEERIALDGPGSVFALELRGEPIEGFDFPGSGLVVVGSEELGVSPEALELCPRRISIPMLGAKGSLNVGVAFGVLLDAWRRSLVARGIEPAPAAP